MILAFVCLQFAPIYFFDILVFSDSLQNHIDQTPRISRLLYEAEVILKLKKRKLFVETINYFGHATRSDHLELAKYSTDAVAKLEHPNTQAEFCSFLGMSNLFRRCVPDFTHLAFTLNNKLRKHQPKTLAP